MYGSSVNWGLISRALLAAVCGLACHWRAGVWELSLGSCARFLGLLWDGRAFEQLAGMFFSGLVTVALARLCEQRGLRRAG